MTAFTVTFTTETGQLEARVYAPDQTEAVAVARATVREFYNEADPEDTTERDSYLAGEVSVHLAYPRLIGDL